MADTTYAPGWEAGPGAGLAKNTATGQVLPTNHPTYQAAMSAAPAAGAATAAPAATTPAGQADQSSYYSSTPTAAPTINSTNQGTQDVVRNAYLQQATQGTDINMNDPVIRQQQDAFESAQERARRNQIADTAEAANAQGSGLGDSGALTSENRLINEQSAQADSGFAAQLAANELQNRRAEIQNALSGLNGMVTGDQARQLQLELAQIQEKLGYADINLRDKLGMGSLSNQLLGINNQNDQFNKQLGFNVGAENAGLNQQALLALLNG